MTSPREAQLAETETISDPTVITLGCRLNAYEFEVMRRHARAAGLDNAVIINTCAVTGEAVRNASQTIRRVRRENPTARIIVTGCAAQMEPERFAEMSEVDHVIGNAEKMKAETFAGLAMPDSERVQVNDIMSVRETASHMIDGFGTRARAYVQIQNGCDHRCTFCIIPFGRGPSRSVPAGDVVAEIRRLVENGYRGSRADRRRHHVLWRRSAGQHDARQARAPDPEACAGAARVCGCRPSIRWRPIRI